MPNCLIINSISVGYVFLLLKSLENIPDVIKINLKTTSVSWLSPHSIYILLSEAFIQNSLINKVPNAWFFLEPHKRQTLRYMREALHPSPCFGPLFETIPDLQITYRRWFMHGKHKEFHFTFEVQETVDSGESREQGFLLN